MSNIKLITVTNAPKHATRLIKSAEMFGCIKYFKETGEGLWEIVKKETKITYPVIRQMICGVYEIKSPTGKVYIGQSRNILKRWDSYKFCKCKDQRVIYNSLIRHTPEKHSFKILKQFYVDCDQSELDIYERNKILWNISKGVELLNLTIGGFSTKYCTETRNLISQSKKGKPTNLSGYWAGKTGAEHPSFGRKKTDEQKKKQSDALKLKFREKTLAKIVKQKKESENYWTNVRPKRNLEVFAKPIVQLTDDDVFIKEWESQASIEKELGICHRTIKKYCLGLPVRYGKHNFKYKSDYEHQINNSL